MTQTMDREAVLDEFRAADALLEGHFVLSSGLHSSVYLQCARVLMSPARAERLCIALADRVRAAGIGPIDLVVSPAMGGVVVGYETARHLDVDALFVERVDGSFQLRRGFRIEPGARVLMVEDVITTGLSSREAIACIERAGGHCVAGACLVDRSSGRADIGVPLVSLVTLEVPAWPEHDLPPELAAIPAVKPGSRGMN